MIRPAVKHRFRPQMSVSLPAGIIRAAMTSRKMVMAVWTPCTLVCRSALMSLIITFMFEPAKLQMNWARASGTSTLRRAAEGRVDVSATAGRAFSHDRRPSRVIEPLVEVDGGVDQRQVGERL